METVGVIATVVVGFFLLVVLVFAVVAIPDIARYMRVRRM